jgi:hypothetical protein
MTPEQFVYWLQGYSEVAQQVPTAEQWQIVQDHLKLVFSKETPMRTLGEESNEISNKASEMLTSRLGESDRPLPRREVSVVEVGKKLCAPAVEYPFEALRFGPPSQPDCSTLNLIQGSC